MTRHGDQILFVSFMVVSERNAILMEGAACMKKMLSCFFVIIVKKTSLVLYLCDGPTSVYRAVHVTKNCRSTPTSAQNNKT